MVSVPPGAAIDIVVLLERADTLAPLAGETVQITSGNTLTGTTDSSGQVVFPITAPSAAGTYTVVAHYSGNAVLGYQPATFSTTFTVTGGITPPPPTNVIPLVVVAGVIVAGAGIYVVLRRRKR